MFEQQITYAKQLSSVKNFCKGLTNVSIYFDQSNNWVIFRSKVDIFIVFLENYQLSLKTKINCDENTQILQLSMNKANNLIAYQISSSTIIINDPKLNKQIKKNEMAIDISQKNNKYFILKIEWIYNNPNGVNFMICHNQGIIFYKIDFQKLEFKIFKTVNQNIQSIWFEGDQEIIGINSQNEPQKIRFLYVSQNINSKYQNLNQVQLELDNRIDQNYQEKGNFLSIFNQNKSENQYQQGLFYAESDLRHKNLSIQNLNEKDIKNHFNKILFTKIYRKTYFIHLNSLQGICYLYKLILEPNNSSIVIQLFTKISVPSDCFYQLLIYDNIFYINNITEKMTFAFDIKKHKPEEQLIYPFKIQIFCKQSPNLNNQFVLNTMNSIKQEQNQLSQNNLIDFSENLDDLIKQSDKNKNNSIYELTDEEFYCEQNKFLGGRYIINVEKLTINKITTNIQFLSSIIRNKVDGFFYILRRKNPNQKEISLEFLKEMLREKLEIMKVFYVFRNLVNNMQLCYIENNKILEENEVYFQDYRILNQKDIYQKVFKVLKDDKNSCKIYLQQVIIQYIKETMEVKMQVDQKIETLLVKLTIKTESYNLLQWLLQYHIINDNIKLAKKLIELETKFRPFFQCGLDMCYRLKQFDKIIEVYCDNGMVFQALSFIKQNNVYQLSLDVLIKGITHHLNVTSNEYVVQFFQQYEKQIYLQNQMMNSNYQLGFDVKEMSQKLTQKDQINQLNQLDLLI